jgi:dTDP-4-amino-4,6-dideoxygalactose transaminase
MDIIQAAILLEKWECFVGWELERRREIAQRYTSCLSDAVRTPACRGRAAVLDVLRHPAAGHGGTRQRAFFEHEGDSHEVYYPKPLHLRVRLPIWAARGEMPASEQASAQALCLPMHPFLTLQDVDFVCAQVREFLTRAV